MPIETHNAIGLRRSLPVGICSVLALAVSAVSWWEGSSEAVLEGYWDDNALLCLSFRIMQDRGLVQMIKRNLCQFAKYCSTPVVICEDGPRPVDNIARSFLAHDEQTAN